jgi:hypothetical protein
MSIQSTRETLYYELALEWALRVPYAALVAEARRTGACDELDLLQLGHRLLADAGRLARGEISSIEVPGRLPRRGEHARRATGAVRAADVGRASA